MLRLSLLVIIAGAAIYSYNKYRQNPNVIENPVYMKAQVDVAIPQSSRSLELEVIAELVSIEDCESRRNKYLATYIKNCPTCQVESTECKLSLGGQYRALLSKQKANTTYVSLSKGNRYERDARIVIWGLTDREAEHFCEHMKGAVDEKFTGTVECI